MTEFAAVHPAADLFPMLDDAALDQMAADIKARGLVHPIVLTPEGVLLDGRNRVEACRRAGITPRTEIYTGDDPTAYVISVNLERRHLSEDERAFLALELVPLFEAEQDKGGRPTNGEQKPPTELMEVSRTDRESTAKAATSAKVKPSRVRQAKRIKEQAADLIPRVISGAISMSKAETIAKDRTAGITEDHADDWYTPRWLFDSMIPWRDADTLIFDLDVCAPRDPAHRTVPAARHLTLDDDGLAHEWDGLVWCNPPYSQPEVWAERMVKHGDGLLLVHMPNNARWMVDAQWHAAGMVLIQSMHFVRPNGQEQRPGYSLALLAYGDDAVNLLRAVDGPMVGPLLLRVAS